MKKGLFAPLAGAFLVFLAAACTVQENTPAEIQGYETYTDPVLNFSISYPSNWIRRQAAGSRFMAASSEPALDRFAQFTAEGEPGARVAISAVKMGNRSLDEIMAEAREFQDANLYAAPQDAVLGGAPAKKVTYSAQFADGTFSGERYFAEKDSMVTIVEIAAFGGTFDKLRPKFEEMINTVKLAEAPAPAVQRVDTIVRPSEPVPPSDTLRSYNGEGYSIGVPQNFISARGSAKGAISSVYFMGDEGARAENTVQIDVLDASKQPDLNKIVESNKATYRTQTASQTRLAGQNAYYMNYSLRGDVGSRVYFMVNNGRLYRITLNWYKPMEAQVLPVFEKVVNSFKLR